ncbi:hypothetical protein J3F84DRAFT_407842 [Trichoderma pleuroticola]
MACVPSQATKATKEVVKIQTHSLPSLLSPKSSGRQIFQRITFLSSWSSWDGLTPSTTSAAPSPTATWIIAIYSKPVCVGDYYSLEGHNIDSFDNQCIVLRSGNLPNASTTDMSCQWFTNGGSAWNDCSTSTLTQPVSWSVLGCVCIAYDTDNCTNDDTFDPSEGCRNCISSSLDTKSWISLQCGA